MWKISWWKCALATLVVALAWCVGKIRDGITGDDALQAKYISAQTETFLRELETVNGKPFRISKQGTFHTVSRWSSGNTNVVVCDLYLEGINRKKVEMRWDESYFEGKGAKSPGGVRLGAIYFDEYIASAQHHDREPLENEFRISLVFYIEPTNLNEWLYANLD